jgi:hypothetical protein
MWHFLFSTYSGENYSRKLQGIKSICAIRYQGGSVPEYIDKALGLLHSTIVAAGKDQISLTELCLALVLNGLPNRFSSARSQLESNSTNLQLSHVIRSKILEEDERQSLRNTYSSTGGGIALGLNSNRDGRCSHGFPPTNCWKCHPEKHPDNFTCKDCNQKGHRCKLSRRCSQSSAQNSSKPGGSAGAAVGGKDPLNDPWELPKPNFENGFAGGVIQTQIVMKNDLRLTMKPKTNSNKQTVAENDLRVALMTTKRQRTAQDMTNYVIDSGCTESILKNKQSIQNYHPFNQTMRTADDGILICIGRGDLSINPLLTIHNVLYCPKATMNLLSSSQICDEGFTINMDRMNLYVMNKSTIILRAAREENLYQITIPDPNKNNLNSANSATLSSNRTELAHRRCGHLNLHSLRLLSHLSEGLILDNDPKGNCKVCSQTKSTRHSFPPSDSQASRIGELTHMDVCSIGVPTVLHSFLMFLVMLDDATRWLTIFLLNNKDDAGEHIENYCKQIKNITNRYPGILQCDGGGEFINNPLSEFCQERGIHVRSSTAYTPEQNSRAERINRTVIEGVSSMLLDCQLPLSYWGFAAEAFVYVKNRSPHAKLHRSTPYEQWFRKLPDLTNLHVFGFKCYVHVAKEIRKTMGPGNKLLPKAREMIFVGYSLTKKAWRCYDPISKILTESIHVRFDDESIPINGIRTTIPSFSELPNLTDYSGTLPGSGVNEKEPNSLPVPSLLPLPVPVDIALENQATLPNNIASTSNHPSENPPSHQGEDSNDDNQNQPNIDESSTTDVIPSNPINSRPVDQSNQSYPSELPDQSLLESIAENERQQATPIAVPYSGSIQPEVVYKSSAGLWKYVDSSSKTNKWDPANLPEAGSKRTRKPRTGFAESLISNADEQNSLYNLVLSTVSSPLSDSPSYHEAIQRPDRNKWITAIGAEYAALFLNKTFSQPMTLPPGHRAIDTKMVLKIKEPEFLGAEGRYKARLCPKGFQQTYLMNYFETFAPVATYNSLRLFLTIMASMDYEIDVIDVITAFLLSTLEEEVYIKIPPGYPKEHKEGQVLRLLKGLYGLKQGPHTWNNELDSFLKSIEFEPTISDPCLYYRKSDAAFMIVWVDDIILATPSSSSMAKLKHEINSKFPCHNKGPISIYLNLLITRNRKERVIYISQPTKIDNVLNDDQLSPDDAETISRPSKIPAVATTMLTKEMEPKTLEEAKVMKTKPYRSILGQLIHICITARPDISTAVSCCGKYAQNPGTAHWDALLLILRYLKGTKLLRLRLGGIFNSMTLSAQIDDKHNLKLSAACDSDWAGDIDDRRSRSGYCVFLNDSLIQWSSKLQKSVALSSTEAEYICLSSGTATVLWYRSILEELGFQQKQATIISQDNQSAIRIAESKKQAPGVKHISIRYHFIRDKIASKEIQLKAISTSEMVADLFTKNLSFPRFQTLRSNLGMATT